MTEPLTALDVMRDAEAATPWPVPVALTSRAAADLGLSNVVLTGPADDGILESLCSYPWPRHERLS